MNDESKVKKWGDFSGKRTNWLLETCRSYLKCKGKATEVKTSKDIENCKNLLASEILVKNNVSYGSIRLYSIWNFIFLWRV